MNNRQAGCGDDAGGTGFKPSQTDALAKLLIEKGLITEAE